MMERGWGDGLPMIPATPERVAAMLAGAGRPAGDLVAILPPRLGRATVERDRGQRGAGRRAARSTCR